MKKMTGIFLMIIGALSITGGIILYNYPVKAEELAIDSKDLDEVISMAIADGVLTDNERELISRTAEAKGLDSDSIIKDAEKRLGESSIKSETELIDYNKKNGDDFEKFIVKKFNQKYFTVKDWAGDKYVDGIYADTTKYPDLRIELRVKDKTSKFSVECKWRQKLPYNGIEFAYKEQFYRYKEFEEERKTPVFIAIGIGGIAFSPEKLYIVPLRDLKSNFISFSELQKYVKKVDGDFFFDMKTLKLR